MTTEKNAKLTLEEAVAIYLSSGEQAKSDFTADEIPDEVKKAMGLDSFPEDIQDDILTLSRKIIEYAQACAKVAVREQAKGDDLWLPGMDWTRPPRLAQIRFDPPPTTYVQPSRSMLDKLITCAKYSPVLDRQIYSDALNTAMRSLGPAAAIRDRLPGLLGTTLPATSFLRTPVFSNPLLFGTATFIGHILAGSAIHLGTCMAGAFPRE